jgi:hypothetical protein
MIVGSDRAKRCSKGKADIKTKARAGAFAIRGGVCVMP